MRCDETGGKTKWLVNKKSSIHTKKMIVLHPLPSARPRARALATFFFCSFFDGWVFTRVIGKRPRKKKLAVLTKEEKRALHLETLFNTTCFFFIQVGECMFAVYTTLLFVVVRFGPNSDHSSLSKSRVTEDGFKMILTFLCIIVINEFLVMLVAMKYMSKVSRNALDPRPFLGDFARENTYFLFFVPVLLNFPCSMLLLDHSGMDLEIGE